MRRAGLFTALLLVGAAGVAMARARRSGAPAPAAQEHEQERGRTRPGPDSGRVAQVIAELSAADPMLCTMIADQIGNFWFGGDRGVGVLADASPAPRAAIDSLHGQVTNPGAIALLVRHLGDERPCVRRASAKLLGRSAFGTSRLVQLLDDSSRRVREAAALAIGTSERYAARAALEMHVADREEPVAAMAAWALAELHDSVAVPVFIKALRSPHARVRSAALSGLANSEAASARGEVEGRLRDDDAGVREAAARTLADIGSAQSAALLAARLSDVDRDVRYAAASALADLHDLHQAPPELVRATHSTDPRLADLAVGALAEIEDPATVDDLISAMGARSRDTRVRVVEALGSIGSRKAADALLKALKDPDPEVRRAAAEALGELKER